jgi:hypothetical protein
MLPQVTPESTLTSLIPSSSSVKGGSEYFSSGPIDGRKPRNESSAYILALRKG